MKKRILGLLMALVMILSLVPATAFATGSVASGTCGAEGDNLTWTLDSNGTLTISGEGEMADWGNGKWPQWHNLSSNIRTVIIDDGVTSIGGYALDECWNLTGITIPDSVTSIGSYAFMYCNKLANITIPDSVTSIGSGAFFSCSSLTGVTIPYSVTNIGEKAFYRCSKLTNIIVDSGNENYSSHDGVLYDKNKTELIRCLEVKSGTVTIPSSVISIDSSAFEDCNRLTNIIIPDSVTSIGDAAFHGCSGVTNIVIPNSVTSMGIHTFGYCTSLTDITIPESVTSISGGMFGACSSLTDIILPDSVTSIGDSAFSNCSNLIDIKIPDSVTNIGSNAFVNCTSLTDVYYGGTESDWNSILIDDGNVALQNATIHYSKPSEQIVCSGTATIGGNMIYLPDGGMVYYAFMPEESGQYLFTSGEGENTYGRLLDENYAVIEEDDDSGDAQNFLITHNLEAGKTYYIGVKYLDEQAGTIATYIERHEHEFGYYSQDWQWDGEKCENVDVGHVAYCGTCGGQIGEVEPHDFQEDVCTVCGAVNRNHEHVFWYYDSIWQWDEEKCEDVNIGHAPRCRICNCQMGEVEQHTFQNNSCTVCHEIDPNHEHIVGYYSRVWDRDEETGNLIEVEGHRAHCGICGEEMGDIEPHTYDGDYCTACDAINPDHEHVWGNWERIWNEDLGPEISTTHVQVCPICRCVLGDIEPHTYDGNYCTVCGAVDPSHEHVLGRWDADWSVDIENSVGHYPVCSICERQMGDIVPHTFVHGRCVDCGYIRLPDHHEHDYFYLADEDGHVKNCNLCAYDEDTEAHIYDENGVCTVCGWIQGAEDIVDISIRNGENKELIITLTCANGWSDDLTVEKVHMPFGTQLWNGWVARGLLVYTDKGTVRLYFSWDKDGRFRVINSVNRIGMIESNILDKCELFDVYRVLWNENIVNPSCVFDGNVWVVDGKAYDGEPVHMTLDGNGNVLTYEVIECEHPTWIESVTTPTCTEDGMKTITCSVCGETVTEVIPALGHNWGAWTSVSNTQHQRVCANDPSHMEAESHHFANGLCDVCGYEAGTSLLGDVNNDGKVNQKDVARLRQYIGDAYSYPLDATDNADVNKDGKINQKDVARLRQYIGDSKTYPLG